MNLKKQNSISITFNAFKNIVFSKCNCTVFLIVLAGRYTMSLSWWRGRNNIANVDAFISTSRWRVRPVKSEAETRNVIRRDYRTNGVVSRFFNNAGGPARRVHAKRNIRSRGLLLIIKRPVIYDDDDTNPRDKRVSLRPPGGSVDVLSFYVNPTHYTVGLTQFQSGCSKSFTGRVRAHTTAIKFLTIKARRDFRRLPSDQRLSARFDGCLLPPFMTHRRPRGSTAVPSYDLSRTKHSTDGREITRCLRTCALTFGIRDKTAENPHH